VSRPPLFLARLTLAGLVATGLYLPLSARADEPAYACSDNAHLGRLFAPLARMRRLIAAGQPVTIMALGSSSTAGAGATTPAAAYPARLEAELRSRFPGVAIAVLNRGVNGEEAGDMLARFDQAATDDKPDVVLWQVGTNSVLRDHPIGPVDRLIIEGLARMKALGTDVVLIDPQFAPKVLAKPDAEGMVSVIAAASTGRGVDLFSRFAVMKEWHDAAAIPFEAFLSPDLLHMNDWGYACFAKLLAAAMAEAATRPVVAAGTIPPK
jgi:lysophospholipase L1-like esterase